MIDFSQSYKPSGFKKAKCRVSRRGGLASG